MNLSKDVKVSQVMGYFAAGQAAKTSAVIIDMQGYAGCMFVALLGTVTTAGVIELKVQADSVVGMGTVADVVGAVATLTDIGGISDGMFVLVDVYRPQRRFLRAVLTTSAQNTVICGIVAIQYQAGAKPTTAAATLGAQALIVDPA